VPQFERYARVENRGRDDDDDDCGDTSAVFFSFFLEDAEPELARALREVDFFLQFFVISSQECTR
jgi:hypothetical protein